MEKKNQDATIASSLNANVKDMASVWSSGRLLVLYLVLELSFLYKDLVALAMLQ